MMLCCLLMSVALMPVFAPLMRRMPGFANKCLCCLGAPRAARRTPLSVSWLIIGSGALLVVGYLALAAPAVAGDGAPVPMSDAQLWLEALHDAWCLPARG